MKLKQSSIGMCVGVAVACWLAAGAAQAEVFKKGSPVQILTKEKAVAGSLETDSNAATVKVTTAEKKTVTLNQDQIKEVRLLKNCGPKAIQGKVDEARTRGSGDFTAQLKAAYEAFFTDKDVRTSSGTMTSLGQVVLDQIHPTATLVRVSVSEVRLTYPGDIAPKDLKDVQKFDVRLVLYWKGWITDSGYTKVAMTYDREVGRWTKSEVLDTNGTTNKEIGETAAKVGLALLLQMLIDSAK